jgi:hypothetical protein
MSFVDLGAVVNNSHRMAIRKYFGDVSEFCYPPLYARLLGAVLYDRAQLKLVLFNSSRVIGTEVNFCSIREFATLRRQFTSSLETQKK